MGRVIAVTAVVVFFLFMILMFAYAIGASDGENRVARECLMTERFVVGMRAFECKELKQQP